MQISELMTRTVVTLTPTDSLAIATSLMRKHNIRHLPVFADDKLVGLVTQRDLLRCLGGLPRTAARATHVEEAMERDVVTVAPTTSLRAAIDLMIENKLGCLPVVQNGNLLGILTEADVLRFADQAAARDERREQAAAYAE